MALDSAPDWSAVIISLFTLAWTVKENLTTRRELRMQERRAYQLAERQEHRALLDNFLLPLATSLARSKCAFELLATDHAGEVHRLEYFPSRLRSHFESLPDARRIFWRVQINQLHDHNEHSIRLIDDYGSRSRLSAQFQLGVEDFRRHARTWKAMWDAVTDPAIPADKLPGDLIANPFPNGFDALVAQEVARVRTEAGE